MKRNLSMVLAGLLVFVMASPLYAAPDIKVNGQIRTRLRYWVNIDLDNDSSSIAGTADGLNNSDRRYFDIRTRLGVDAKLSDGVRAVIQLEKYHDFGNLSPSSVASGPAATGTTPGTERFLATPSNSPQDMYVRQAWMDFAIPGLQEEGIRFQAGRSFFRLGNGYLWGNSLTGEDGLTLYGPLGPGNFKIRFAQTNNQSKAQLGRTRMFDNETSHWAVDYKFEVAEKQNVEVYFAGQLDKAVDRYTSGTAGTAMLSSAAVRHADEYYFGVAYDGVAGPVALKFEGIYNFGKARRNAAFDTATSAPCTVGSFVATCTREDNIDREAFFAYGEATYKIIPAWNVGIAFTVASGDDNPNDDTYDNFVAPLSEYTTTPNRVWTDSEFFYGNRTSRQVGNAATNRVFDFWGRGTVDVDVVSSTGDNGTAYSPGLFELEFKTKYTFNKKTAVIANIKPNWAMNHPDGSGRYMGTALDAKLAYKPYKNIAINTTFAYFVSGSFFDTGGTLAASQSRLAADDAWTFRTEAIVSF